MRRRVDPLTSRVDVREDFDGADNGVGGDLDPVGFVNNVAEGAPDVAVSPGEEARCVRVAVKRAAVEFIVVGDLADALPVDEAFVDFLLKLVAADAAVRLMELEARKALWRSGGFRDSAAHTGGFTFRAGFFPRALTGGRVMGVSSDRFADLRG